MVNFLCEILKFGREWQDVLSDALALKKEIYTYENKFFMEIGDEDDFLLRLEPHICILLKKLNDQWNVFQDWLAQLDPKEMIEDQMIFYFYRLGELQSAVTDLSNAHHGREI